MESLGKMEEERNLKRVHTCVCGAEIDDCIGRNIEVLKRESRSVELISFNHPKGGGGELSDRGRRSFQREGGKDLLISPRNGFRWGGCKAETEKERHQLKKVGGGCRKDDDLSINPT